MSVFDLNNIEQQLTEITANHKPELDVDYAVHTGQKFSNNDTDTSTLQIFTEQRADLVYDFMRKVLGDNPYVTKP